MKQKFIQQNKEIFTGVGKFDKPYHIELAKNAVPVVKPPRRVPLKVKEKLKDALDLLVQKQIISKVNEARDWVHNLVIVEKLDGNLRLCLDPRNLNKYVKKEQHPIPTLEEITAKLGGASYFTVLDLKEGFHQVELDEESKKLCSFSTPFGVYQYNRLPFGLTTAGEIFQRKNEENFGDIPNVIIYIDDVLIYGKSLEEHDKFLNMVVERAKNLNIKFSDKKVQLKQHEV